MAVKDNGAVSPGTSVEHSAEHPGLSLFCVTPRFDLCSELNLFPFAFNKAEPPAVPLHPACGVWYVPATRGPGPVRGGEPLGVGIMLLQARGPVSPRPRCQQTWHWGGDSQDLGTQRSWLLRESSEASTSSPASRSFGAGPPAGRCPQLGLQSWAQGPAAASQGALRISSHSQLQP